MRNIEDTNLAVSKALPAAAANVDSDAIDLGLGDAENIKEAVIAFGAPATPALVEDKDLTITLEDSADGETFAAVPSVAPLVITGGVGDGADAAETRIRFPEGLRRYIHVNAAVETGGGDNTAVDFYLKLLF